MSLQIQQFAPGTHLNEFIGVQREVFRGDPHYIPPLDFELRERVSPKKNPFFEHAEGTLFVAKKDGRLVGRCSAQICQEHLRAHDDAAGFFGFFDTIDDQDVATALLSRAEKWLGERGMKTMRGPFSLSINEESGTLVEGFDSPPVIMMPHSREWQGGLAEAYGLQKSKDLLAWKYNTEAPPPRVKRAWEAMNALPEVSFRSVDMKNLRRELDLVIEIFNDAWADNWGFVPSTEAEVNALAELLQYILDPRMAFFVEVKGEPVGMVVCLPNINEATRDLNGKLAPFGWAKLVWRLKVQKVRSARLMLLGIKQKMRGVKRYGALSTAMYAELVIRAGEYYDWAELGWTLEDNKLINLGIRGMRAKVYKKYRVYEKAIG